MTNVYEVSALTKRYRGRPNLATDNVDLTIHAGEFVGILGPNGAGKTTLIKQLVGLLRPTSGSIRLLGSDLVRSPDIARDKVGYYGQKVAALRYHTCREVIQITGCLRGLKRGEARAQTVALLDRFELSARADRPLIGLSGGEQRIAVLLATFIGQPPVIVLDEPTNELDPEYRRRFWLFVKDYIDRNGATVILTTHNLSEAEHVIESVVFINQGRVIADASLSSLRKELDVRRRFEVELRDDEDSRVSDALIAMGGTVHNNVWEIDASSDRNTSVLASLVTDPRRFTSFRLVNPTLEDLYMDLVKGKTRAPEPNS